jgi:F-type H+-transporting ATPase subunit b
MIYLLDFDPIKPDFGLLLWTTIIFLGFWMIVGRYAFKPIATALRKREVDIQSALDQAKVARDEMSNLKAENEKLLAEAREERARILNDAKSAGDQMVQDAKKKAKEEAQKIVSNALAEIENQKKHALVEVKNQLGNMALGIAEQVLRKELKQDQSQQELVTSLVKEIKLN